MADPLLAQLLGAALLRIDRLDFDQDQAPDQARALPVFAEGTVSMTGARIRKNHGRAQGTGKPAPAGRVLTCAFIGGGG
jgi:hypothetical protein